MAINDSTFNMSVMASQLATIADTLGRYSDEVGDEVDKLRAAYACTITDLECLSVAMATYLTQYGAFRGKHVDEVLEYFRQSTRPAKRPQPQEGSDGAAEGHPEPEDYLAK